jgi:putative restriction endonuclease
VFGSTDLDVRLAAFRWLDELRARDGDILPRTSLLSGFAYGSSQVGLMSPAQGIWKPAICQLPLSVATTIRGPYSDSFDQATGRIRYSYRGSDIQHRDNRGLRTAMQDRVPIIYLHAVERGQYLAFYPAFVTQDDPANLRFWVQVDDASSLATAMRSGAHGIAEDEPEARRAYVTSSVRRRLHQATFRQQVLRAYRQMCSLCRLRHTELLDAAHITPDSDDDGLPVTSNGLSLCKLHHAAFDNFFFTVTPEYRVEVRPSILAESDGPMLVVGLQEIQGKPIELPARRVDRPDLQRLEVRMTRFRAAS